MVVFELPLLSTAFLGGPRPPKMGVGYNTTVNNSGFMRIDLTHEHCRRPCGPWQHRCTRGGPGPRPAALESGPASSSAGQEIEDRYQRIDPCHLPQRDRRRRWVVAPEAHWFCRRYGRVGVCGRFQRLGVAHTCMEGTALIPEVNHVDDRQQSTAYVHPQQCERSGAQCSPR